MLPRCCFSLTVPTTTLCVLPVGRVRVFRPLLCLCSAPRAAFRLPSDQKQWAMFSPWSLVPSATWACPSRIIETSFGRTGCTLVSSVPVAVGLSHSCLREGGRSFAETPQGSCCLPSCHPQPCDTRVLWPQWQGLMFYTFIRTHSENGVMLSLSSRLSLSSSKSCFDVTLNIFEPTQNTYFGMNFKDIITRVSQMFWREGPDRRI